MDLAESAQTEESHPDLGGMSERQQQRRRLGNSSSSRTSLTLAIIAFFIVLVLAISVRIAFLFENDSLLLHSSPSSFHSVPRPKNKAKASSITTTSTSNNDNNNINNADEEEEDNVKFCASIQKASTAGSSQSQHRMIHVLVSNAGHFNFLHNALLSMQHATDNVNWIPVILGIGSGVCPLLYNQTTLHNNVICVPYLHRLLYQLARDEPESIVQIEKENAVQNHNGNITKIYESIDTTFYGWGAIEHKFLINAKLYAIRDVLTCGYDVFVTDTDVAFRKDPRPYITTPKATTTPSAIIQVYAQNDTNRASYPLDINSGFMYWKYSLSNIQLIHDIITIPPFWHIDQSRVNFMLENHSTPHQLLSTLQFPNGQMFLHHRDMLNMSNIVVFHANYNSKQGEKENMLREMGLWFLD